MCVSGGDRVWLAVRSLIGRVVIMFLDVDVFLSESKVN